MRILVCGSRTYELDHVLPALLDSYINTAEHVVIINGGATGADRIAREHGWIRGVPVEIYEADWDHYGKSAGVIRNQFMLDESKPDLVLAFVDKNIALSKGTNDMVVRAKKAGVPTYVVEKVK